MAIWCTRLGTLQLGPNLNHTKLCASQLDGRVNAGTKGLGLRVEVGVAVKSGEEAVYKVGLRWSRGWADPGKFFGDAKESLAAGKQYK